MSSQIHDAALAEAASPDLTTAANGAPNTSLNAQSPEERKSQPHALNPRSCTTCRRRKVKCNKENPCSNCVKAGIRCVFPAPGRAPRRPRQPGTKVVSEREVELLKRLRRLEGVVEELSGQIDVEAVKHSPSSDSHACQKEEDGADTPGSTKSGSVRVVGMDEGGGNRRLWMARAFRIGHGPPKTAYTGDEVATGFGRLVLDEGRSEYVASPFWASVSDELDEIRGALNDHDYDSDSDTPIHPSDDITEPNHQSFIMGYNSSDVNLKTLHPLPSQLPFYWQTFLENVEPLTKIIHKPTMNKTIKDVQGHMDSLSPSTEALMFSIYFATTTSMTAQEVRTNLGVEKDSLLKQYRFGVEQALARASFLNTNEIVTVQAFVLFLVCVRRHDDTRFVWSLTGLAVRIAQSLGLHRDGTKFGLSPFDVEMRRRIWWQVCVLDTRASEDHGSDPAIFDYTFDTKFPLNINDEDLAQDATEPPIPQVGVSEMTFCLIRYEICSLTRRITYTAPEDGICEKEVATLSLEDKERIIRDVAAHLEKTYLQYCTDAGPLYWVAATVARLIIAKMSLITYHPFVHPGKTSSLSQDIKDRLFVASIEIIEYSRLLESEHSTKQWGWLFHTYIQWHAIAYILGELCVRDNSPMVKRAWDGIDACWDEWHGRVRMGKSGTLWQPMRKLMAHARRKREQNVSIGTAGSSPEQYCRPPVQAYAGSLQCPGTIARDRLMQQPANSFATSDKNIPQAPTTMDATQFDPGSVQPDMERMLTMMVPDQVTNGTWLTGGIGGSANRGDGNISTMDMPPYNPAENHDLDMDLGNAEWEGWDEMVREFQLQADNGMGGMDGSIDGARGPTMAGMGGWW